MRKVIEADLEEPLEDVFDEFEEEALAAASIGQVYRAKLHDGRRVAVKVQYPTVAQAVRADMQNLGLILRAAKTMAPGIDSKAMAAEIRERIYEELDYEHEAQAQRQMARLWRGHPFVVIPDVVTRLSRERVLVTEWVDGERFDDVKELPQEERNRFAEIVLRFFVGGLYRTGFISGDPHPGNFLLQDDGRVAFLDFGMTRHVPRGHVEDKIALFRAGLDRRRAALPRLRRADRLLPRRGGPAREGARPLLRGLRVVARGPRLHDRPALHPPRDDRPGRPALGALGDHAQVDDPGRGAARGPHGDADAGRARPARGDRELAPDHGRVHRSTGRRRRRSASRTRSSGARAPRAALPDSLCA